MALLHWVRRFRPAHALTPQLRNHSTPASFSSPRCAWRRLPFGHKVPLSFWEPHLGSVVGLLLSHAEPALRKLGVDLLINFIKCQVGGQGRAGLVAWLGSALLCCV